MPILQLSTVPGGRAGGRAGVGVWLEKAISCKIVENICIILLKEAKCIETERYEGQNIRARGIRKKAEFSSSYVGVCVYSNTVLCPTRFCFIYLFFGKFCTPPPPQLAEWDGVQL